MNEKIYNYVKDNISSKIKKIYGTYTEEACKELFSIIEFKLNNDLFGACKTNYLQNPKGTAQLRARSYLEYLTEENIKNIGKILGKTEQDILDILNQQQRKKNNTDFYEDRLNKLKKSLLDKEIYYTGKPIGYAGVNLYLPEGYKKGAYKITSIKHNKNKDYVIGTELYIPKAIENIINSTNNGYEITIGKGCINETVERYYFSEDETFSNPEINKLYMSWQNEEQQKRKEKLETYKDKKIKIMKKNNKGHPEYLGELDIINFIDPNTYKAVKSINNIELREFEILLMKGKYERGEGTSHYCRYYIADEETYNEDLEKKNMRDLSISITKHFENKERKGRKSEPNIGYINLCIINYIKTGDEIFLKYFNKGNKSDIPLKELKDFIDEKLPAKEYKIGDTVNIKVGNENRIFTLGEKVGTLGKIEIYKKEGVTHIHDNVDTYFDKIFPHIKFNGNYITHEEDLKEAIGYTNDVPTDEKDEIVFAKRRGRNYFSRFVKTKKPLPESKITIILRRFDNNKYLIATARCGGFISSYEPGNAPTKSKYKEGIKYWKNHALVRGTQEIDERSITNNPNVFFKKT